MSTPDVTHYFTGEQVLRRSWDENKEALKVIPSQDTEFSIELNHQDGDSVSSMAKTMTISISNSPVDCSDMRRCMVYKQAEVIVEVMVSPIEDGDVFFPLVVDKVTELCAKRIKMIIPEGAEAYLVLQS